MIKTENLSKNIKNLIYGARISESELARLTGISQPIINRLAQGITTNPNINTLRPIAKFFNITIDQLIGDKPLFTPNTEELILSSNWTQIPVLKLEMVNQWQNILKEKSTNVFLHFDTNLSENAYSLLIEDSTMEPTFTKNTYIIIEPELKALDKDFIIVLCNGQNKPLIRQVLFCGDEKLLKPINPDFDTIPLTNKCKIMGVVVQIYTIFHKQ